MMKAKQSPRFRFCLACAFILWGLSAGSSLGLMVKLSTAELVARSQWVVTATVNEIRSERSDDVKMIYTYVTISVDDWIKGEPQEGPLVIRIPGGRVGSITYHVSDEPKFNVNETVLLFLEPEPGKKGTLRVTGSFQGKCTVQDGRIVENGLWLDDFVAGVKGISPMPIVGQKAAGPSVAAPTFVPYPEYWLDEDMPIHYYINEDGLDDCVFDEHQAIRRGGQAWQRLPGAYFSLCYGGTTTTNTIGEDGENVVCFGSISSDYLAKAHWWDDNDVIHDADVVFNDNKDWSACSGASCNSLRYDVQAVATHEFGHWLSLDHSDSVWATMYVPMGRGAIWQRYPKLDDIYGIRHFYPHSDGAAKPQPGCWPWIPGLLMNFTSATLVDIDRDGFDEVIVGAIGDANGVWALNHDASADWEDGLSTGELGLSVPASADLDGDNWPDIIVGNVDGEVQVRGRNDTAVQGWPKTTGDDVNTAPAIGEIDDIVGLEVVVGSDDGKVYAWHAGGTVLDRDGEAPWDWPQTTGDMVRSSPALGDLDGDSFLDIIVGSDDGSVYAWDYTGTAIAGWPKATGDKVRSSPALGDIDDDDELEIIVGSDDGNVYAWNADGTVVDQDGMAPWDWPQTTGDMVRSSPALGDIDQDGDLDIVVGSDDGYIYAWDHTGASLTGWPVSTGGPVRSSPIIGDIDGDWEPEVVVGSDDTQIYALNGDGSNADDWPFDTAGPIDKSAVLGDLDGNGEQELCIAAAHPALHGFHCWDLGSPYDADDHPELWPWPVFGHDRYHTSLSGFQPPAVLAIGYSHDFDLGWGDDDHWGSDSQGCPVPDYSTSSYLSPPSSLKISGSSGPDAYAWAQSRNVNISFVQPYHVRFYLRPLSFSQTRFFDFGHIKLLLDSPTTPLEYDTVGDGTYAPIGPPVGDYLTCGPWNLFELDADPSASQYTIHVNGFPVGTASYDSSLIPSPAVYLEDGPDPGSFLEAYYDDIEVMGSVLPGPPYASGDYDGDADVDGADIDAFKACVSGPTIPLAAGCELMDLDGDNDVDQTDFGMFQRCYSGEGNPADPDCVDG